MHTHEEIDPSHRWGGVAGLVALAAGAAGGALERGWPSGNNPMAVAAFVAEHRAAILGQSVLFLISSASYLVFAGYLRARVAKAEGGAAPLSSIVFGAAMVWITLGMAAQAFQIGLTMAARQGVLPPMMWTMAALFAVSNLPCGVMLAAFAVASWRSLAFPRWLGAISIAAAAAQVLLASGAVVTRGPLAPNGWLTYALYPTFAIWLVPTTILLMRRAGEKSGHQEEVQSATRTHVERTA